MKKILSGLMGLAILAAMIGLVYLVARGFVDWFTGLDNERALAVVALGGLVLTPIISFVTTRALERKKLTGQAALEHKIDLYEEFMEFFVAMMKLDGGTGYDEAEVQRRMAKMTPNIIIYASNDFLKEWRAFRRMSSDGSSPQDVMWKMEDVLKAFRKDLGHNTWLLNKGDILSVFITDIDSVVE